MAGRPWDGSDADPTTVAERLKVAVPQHSQESHNELEIDHFDSVFYSIQNLLDVACWKIVGRRAGTLAGTRNGFLRDIGHRKLLVRSLRTDQLVGCWCSCTAFFTAEE
jgi:hypothetical protein